MMGRAWCMWRAWQRDARTSDIKGDWLADAWSAIHAKMSDSRQRDRLADLGWTDGCALMLSELHLLLHVRVLRKWKRLQLFQEMRRLVKKIDLSTDLSICSFCRCSSTSSVSKAVNSLDRPCWCLELSLNPLHTGAVPCQIAQTQDCRC